MIKVLIEPVVLCRMYCTVGIHTAEIGKARLRNFISRLVGHYKPTISRLIDKQIERNIIAYPVPIELLLPNLFMLLSIF